VSWFGEPDNRPLLGGDRSKEDKRAKTALEAEGLKTFKMVGTYCDRCGGEDADHIPGMSCEGVN